MRDPKIAYLAVTEHDRRHHVVAVHRDTPDWWRVIATFANRDRADCYACVENDCLDAEAEPRPDEVPAPIAALPPEPISGIGLALLRSPTPVEKARVGVALIEDAAAQSGAAVEIKAIAPPAPAQAAQPSPPPSRPAPSPTITAGTPPELADRPLAALVALEAMVAAGENPTLTHIAIKAGIPTGSMGYVIGSLERAGRVQRNNQGELVVLVPTSEDERRRRPAPASSSPVQAPRSPEAPAAKPSPVRQPSAPVAPSLEEGRVLHAISELHRTGLRPKYDEIGRLTAIKGDHLGPIIDRLVDQKRVTRDAAGLRPFGSAPLVNGDAAPVRRSDMSSAVTSMEDELAALIGDEPEVFAAPVTRRCESCNQLFRASAARETKCGPCSTGSRAGQSSIA